MSKNTIKIGIELDRQLRKSGAEELLKLNASEILRRLDLLPQ